MKLNKLLLQLNRIFNELYHFMLKRVLLFWVVFIALLTESLSQNAEQTEHSKSTQPFQILDQWKISDSAGISVIYDCVFTGREYWCYSQLSDSFYVFNTLKNQIGSYSYASQLISGPKGIAWDGNYIYTSSGGPNNRIYKIDTSSHSVISSFISPHFYFAGMTFDPSANNGNGGFWVLPNTQFSPIYLIDTNGIYVDSIPRSSFISFARNLTLDTSTFTEPHLILLGSDLNLPGSNTLVWFNLTTKQLTNYEYHIFDDAGLCSQGLGIFISNEIFPSNSKPTLGTLSFLAQTNSTEYLAYYLDVPPQIQAPGNDSICNAQLLQIDSNYIVYDNIGATIEQIEPTGSCFTSIIDKTVWFKVPVSTPSFRIQKSDSNFVGCSNGIDREIAVYKPLGPLCSGLMSEVACGDKNGGPWGIFARADVYGQTLGDTLLVQIDADQIENFDFLTARRLPTISRNFELYDTTRYIALYDDEWFLNNPQQVGQAGIDSKVSDEQSLSGSHSLKIEGSEEPEFTLYDIDSSMQLVGFSIYIPSGNQSYFELNDSDSTHLSQFYFNSGGMGFMSLDSTYFSFPYDAWFNIEIYFDLDNERMQLRVDQQPIKVLNLNPISGNTILHSFVFKPSAIAPNNNRAYIDDMLNFIALFPNIPGANLNDFDLQSPNDDANLVIDNGMLYNNVFTWDSTFDSFSSDVEYKLSFYVDFSGQLIEILKIESLNDTSMVLDETLVDSLFLIMGANPNDTLELLWDVNAKTDLNSENSKNGPFEISIYRGTYVGLEINDQSHQIKLFPNPNKGELFVESNLEEFELRIYDLNGRMQLSKTINSSDDKIDIHFLNKGLFLISLDAGSKNWTRKLFVE